MSQKKKLVDLKSSQQVAIAIATQISNNKDATNVTQTAAITL